MYINEVNLSAMAVAEPSESYQGKTLCYGWIEVLVDVPQQYLGKLQQGSDGAQQELDKLYIYKIPEQLEIKPGDILSVPFGSQQVGAIAIRLLTQPNIDISLDKIREVDEVVSSGFFPPGYWELLNRIAAYYYAPLMEVIRMALPPGLLGRSQRHLRLKPENIPPGAEEFLRVTAAKEILRILQSKSDGDCSFKYLRSQVKSFEWGKKQLLERGWVESYLGLPRHSRPQTRLIVTLVDHGRYLNLNKRQLEILKVLQDQGGELWLNDFLAVCKTTTSTLKRLEQQGCIVIQEREKLRRETGPAVDGDQAKALSTAQSQALETINSLTGFSEVLLHGVTGSGKTEVYLQAIAPLLHQGKSALVLVPEIGLTPQLTDRFRARFGDERISVYHSGLSDGERYDTWRQTLTGEPQVLIGTRSALFTPLPNLGLIILDEEHDSSFKQDSQIPTYHARTVARWRAELVNCPLVLGSATPSLESWVSLNAQTTSPPHPTKEREGKPTYYLNLPERINSRPLPPIEIVDMRQELKEGNKSIFSKPLQQALTELKAKNQKGILFIHRRGHSTFVSCRSCGYVLECPHCDVSLSYHHEQEGADQILRCHYCNYGQLHPQRCPECGSPYLKFFGSGTQRVAQELNREFPDLTLIRYDSDTTRTKGAHRELIDRFKEENINLLVGTQMLTKGLDIPEVTLVGIVAADGLLHLSDYRASERAFQTLAQVAGRAGRGEDPGRVILQTYTPEHPVIEAVQIHDYPAFAMAELEQRKVLNYPPYGRLILLRLSSLDAIQVQNTAQIIATTLSSKTGFEILGPAPASILRVANRYRWQILLKIPPNELPDLPNWEEIKALCPTNGSSSVSLTIDVDPINIM
ncbi:MAG TPA: primosomal protein N' [Nostocaceae cyanobacterium]|nr:primosomal protein N' [Nostocaceae cyanobacterium]